jgi:hypothetical protein
MRCVVSLFRGFALLCVLGLLSPLSAEPHQPGGLPYRLLWHSYRFIELSSSPESSFRITSDNGVDPRAIRFTPVTAAGEQIAVCDGEGNCEVRWDPDFAVRNQKIHTNQPTGTVNLQLNWRFSGTVSVDQSVAIDLLLNGRRYLESVYHGLMLFGEMNGVP